MPIFAQTESRIFGEIMNDVVNNTNISRSSIGSKTRTIAESVSRKMGRMWSTFDLNYVQAYLDGAEGQYLDLIGSMMGIERLGETPAAISSSDRVVKYYTEVGNFGDINGASSITITEGTIISTGAAATGILYRLPYTVILPLDQDEVYLAVESIQAGRVTNVGVNELRFHDFTSYTDASNNTLKVTNESEISMARDIESDTNYRFRIANATLTAEAANQTAVRLAALVVPGVADIILLPYNRGIGTTDLIIRAITPTVPDSLVNAVNEAVSAVTAMGTDILIRAPIETGVSMLGTLQLKKKVSATEEQNIIDTATNNIVSYLNNLDISEDFIVNEVLTRVVGSSDVIKNLGVTGRPLDNLFIYRPNSLEDNKIRQTLLGDYTPEAEEKLIVENQYAGTTPVLFRIA
jgi:uncharacterized phage protein gp47/JayE